MPVHTHLAAALRAAGVEFDDSQLTRALYSSDASLYRVVPSAVVKARGEADVIAAHEVARELRIPLTMRGAGTSIAGNAVGSGIVVDTRGFNQVLDIDPVARTARVEPGVVHADLQRAAAPHGLRFGPDPSSHSRCTVGGMIGNNACGSRALGYGRTVDNVESLRVLYGNGELALERAGGRVVTPRRGWRASATPTSPICAPSSAASAARSAATAWSTCCPSGAASNGSWSAARDHWPRSWRRPSASSTTGSSAGC
ncbi:FAD-binding oxidoreductase [Streptomyces sp. MB09-02B]|uniref:FAD-binding oxidoreductase n=1 Tax=Streptomyces sp. MB09-02B TaxID=3028667 RepID=UPI0029A12118|nr:FAD-binding oxidoreductase [Streptomyces sp. MB09-02B]MDX3638053.1 FAD-binding oxidoreductase [Streptomyces sp. MB09-02B]